MYECIIIKAMSATDVTATQELFPLHRVMHITGCSNLLRCKHETRQFSPGHFRAGCFPLRTKIIVVV